MHIFYLSNSTLPSQQANSIHVMKMCQAFARNGHHVTLFGRKGNSLPCDDFSYYGVDNIFQLHKIAHRQWPAISTLVYVARLRRIVLRLRPQPDLFYARDIYSLLAVAPLGRPLIYEVHEPPLHPAQHFLVRLLLQHRGFVRLVAISGALARAYQSRYPDLLSARNLLVAHDSADPVSPHESPDVPLKKEPDQFQVGYVGSLYPGKGVDLIVALAMQLPDIPFHVIGGSKTDINRWRAQNIPSNLYFHGFVSPAQVQNRYHTFDIVLAPYQRSVSGAGTRGGDLAEWMSPLKLFEYMAAGKAIIASDLPVLRELLSHQENALLVAPEDVHGWKTAVQKLRDDPALRAQIAHTARQHFIASHTWQQRAVAVLSDLPAQRGLHLPQN